MAEAVDRTVTSATPVTLAMSDTLGKAFDLGMREMIKITADATDNGLFPSHGLVPPPMCLHKIDIQHLARGLQVLKCVYKIHPGGVVWCRGELVIPGQSSSFAFKMAGESEGGVQTSLWLTTPWD